MTASTSTGLTEFGADVLTTLGVPSRRPAGQRQPGDRRPLGPPVPRHAAAALVRRPAPVRGHDAASPGPSSSSTLARSPSSTADDGIGQVVTERACQRSRGTCRAPIGIGVVAVRNSNHFGTAAYWTRGWPRPVRRHPDHQRQPRDGAVGWDARRPSVPTPGRSPPPAAEAPVVLDIANTGVARGKIYAAAERGEQIPDDWAIDAHGQPDHRPPRRHRGAPRADGGPQGLRHLVHDGRLVRRPDRAATPPTSSAPTFPDQRSGCGHLVIALDVDSAHRRRRVRRAGWSDLIDTTKAVPRAAGVDEIFFPGEIEANAEDAGTTPEVKLPDKTWRTCASWRGAAASTSTPHRRWRR